ncbi:DegT/DnrJ/EryC1/StrS family aminotransferase [Paenibacillus spongiae]|uniref:DegT/DnrJ/EryC1/StrS family aminotransferase n=1 Tax=Paenibacillus spongiae TaxID=2909671 RepID=A0ABY5SH23_9BACL|nr:DegT/DnrJ/EryC1/StrS family aminotransferase [Paenibacillus spongiae]UVI31990.1 DegT/DnrJ/EryC1/StrS family aminotransferase [Paenibacillus spongiae]
MMKSTSKPAILGGERLKAEPWPNWPYMTDGDIEELVQVLKSGNWCRICYGEDSDESKIVQFERSFARMQDARYAVSCSNGTAALEIALRAAGIKPGDEVIVPAFTFIASASAVLQIGGLPVFADIEEDTFCIDPDSVEQLINPNTRGIVVVHMGGRPANMDRIMEIARKHRLIVIEDCAQANLAEWRGQKVGSIGDAGTFSFQNSKNISSGEGGAVTTNSEEIADMSYSLHHIGRKKGDRFYTHHYASWNYRLTEIQAAILLSQMSRAEEQNAIRQENGRYLYELLSGIEGIRLPRQDDRITNNGYHLYLFNIDEERFGINRDLLLEALYAEGVPLFGGYGPLYKNPLFTEKNFGVNGYIEGKTVDYQSAYCPNVEKVSKTGMGFYQSTLLGTREDMETLAESIIRIRNHAHELKSRGNS